MRFGGRYEDMQEARDAIRDILYLAFSTLLLAWALWRARFEELPG